MRKLSCFVLSMLFVALLTVPVCATTYEVGPGKPLAAVGEVPWESLNAGDTVLIYWRDTPYREKFAICREGTAESPITISGVPGPGGELPVLDGENATTRLELSFTSEVRGIIWMGPSIIPEDCTPQHIIIENLEIRNAISPYTFTDEAGSTESFSDNAAAIYTQRSSYLTIRNCEIHDCGNGIFTYSLGDGSYNWTDHVLIEGCYLYNNGHPGSVFEHNSYCESQVTTYQYNHYGPPAGGDDVRIGNAIKERGTGVVVRYNWLEGGNRALDLVNPEDSIRLAEDPLLRETFVYGNVIIERNDDGNSQMIHYGGDTGTTDSYRKGWLYLYNNTFVTYKDATATMRLSTNEESCDCRNNIIYAANAAGDSVSWLDSEGYLVISHNWHKPGIKPTYFGPLKGTIIDDSTSVTGDAPGFADEPNQDFRLAAGSPCIDAGATLDSAALPDNDVTLQYVKHLGCEARPVDATLDIGAYEYAGGQPPDLVITTTSLPGATVGVAYSEQLSATGGVTPYDWSVISGSLPAGLNLSSGGLISGTPTTEETANLTVQVTDSQAPADSDTQTLSISVTTAPPAPTITTTSLPDGQRKVAYSAYVEATGGTTPYTWSVVSGSLPNGLSLNSSTGEISGSPPKTGTFNFTVRCTDDASQYDDQALSITIN